MDEIQAAHQAWHTFLMWLTVGLNAVLFAIIWLMYLRLEQVTKINEVIYRMVTNGLPKLVDRYKETEEK